MSNVSKQQQHRQWSLLMLVTILGGIWLPPMATCQVPRPAIRPLVEIRTSAGNMVVALYNETPQHRDRFLALIEQGVYDSLLFHRVIPGFALEGGDTASRTAAPGEPLGQYTGGPGLPLEVAPGLIHKKGALAAAPLGDTPELTQRSHDSRFFLVQGTTYTTAELDQVVERNVRLGTPFAYTEADRADYATQGGLPRLDGAYTVFGQVIEGIEVIDALAKSPCNDQDRPLEDIRMYMRLLK
jgi:peptidyl-prolyl cis-trans isomerase B (cyclophilin B)